MADDPRNAEAFAIVESARRGDFAAVTSASVLCEVYGALTWSKATSPLSPSDASAVVCSLIVPPSAVELIGDGRDVALLSLKLAGAKNLTARRVHDARHAATALHHGVPSVITYDVDDWADFASDGIRISGPPSVLGTTR